MSDSPTERSTPLSTRAEVPKLRPGLNICDCSAEVRKNFDPENYQLMFHKMNVLLLTYYAYTRREISHTIERLVSIICGASTTLNDKHDPRYYHEEWLG